MTLIRITIPVYKRNTWDNLAEQGIIEISTDCDNLSEAYEQLKPQIADLLLKVQAECQIVVILHELDSQIRERQEALRVLSGQIVRANKQLERLRRFLQSLGINPFGGSLSLDDSIIRNLRPAEVVFDSDEGESDLNHEF